MNGFYPKAPQGASALLCVLLAACGGGGSSSDNSSTPTAVSTFADCYSTALLDTPGTTTSARYNFRGDYSSGGNSNTQSGTLQLDWRVGDLTTFNGQQAYEVTSTSSQTYTFAWTINNGSSTVSGTSTGSFVSNSMLYGRITSPGTMTVFGSTSSTEGSSTGSSGTPSPTTVTTRTTSVTTYSPPSVSRLLTLAVGGTLTETDTSTTVTTHLEPASADTTETKTDTTVYTFVGVETITVPAGTYRTCKVETRDSPASTSVFTAWYVVGKGVMAKMVSSEAGVTRSTQEATALSFNGVAF